MNTSSPIQLDISLLPNDSQKLNQLLQSIYTVGSPDYHNFLSASQFAQEFGSPSYAVSQVTSVLQGYGMAIGQPSPNGLLLPVSTTVGAAESAFGTQITQFRDSKGGVVHTNTTPVNLPPSIKPFVTSVVGLDSAALLQPAIQSRPIPRVTTPVASQSPPCNGASAAASDYLSYTTDSLFNHYGLSSAILQPATTVVGKNQTVALFELLAFNSADTTQYGNCFGFSGTLNTVSVDGGTQTFGAEADLDVELIQSLSPGAKIIAYEAPNTATAPLDEFSRIFSDDTAQVVSVSYGICEQNQDQGTIAAENQLFQEAAAQGQTVLAASGDSGSESCDTGAGGNNTQLAVSDPASQPFVTGVGGTSYNAYLSNAVESAWNDGPTGGAGGGGISSDWTMPSWQRGFGVVNSLSSGVPCGALAGNFCREVPDVSADADPQHGYVVYINSQWTVVGGTSAATPLWASVVALSNQTCQLNSEPNTGFANPRLYSLAESNPLTNISNITQGNNDMTGSNGGSYPAYDPTSTTTRNYYYSMAAGLGVPSITGALFPTPPAGASTQGLLCSGSQLSPIVTSVSPNQAGLAGGTPIAIYGNNFNSITDVHFGSTAATSFKVISSTEIMAIDPPGVQGSTVDITVSQGELTSSVNPPYDQFTYTSGPVVDSVASNYGPSTGGISITVTGLGFTTSSTVSFFTRLISGCSAIPAPASCYIPAAKVYFKSDNQITVVTPIDPNLSSGTPCDLTDVLVTTSAGTSLVNTGTNISNSCPPTSSQETGTPNTGDEFSFTNLPIIASISVDSGPVQGHLPMTITGYNFSSAIGVVFGSSQAFALDFRLISSGQISVEAPPVPYAGTVDVQVETHDANGNPVLSESVPSDQFTYVTCSARYTSSTILGIASATPGGYLLADSSGRVSSCGSSQYFGSVVDPGGFNEVSQPASFGFPIVGISSAPSNQGYWEADSQGHIYTFGNVQFYGDASSQPLRNPIVGIGSTPDGKGYWLVASDGGVFAYGDAQFYGSTGSLTLSRPIVGMISTSDGEGYWLVASDGGVFAFGDAGFYGSKGATILNRPIVGMAATPVGAGYWLIASDGGVFAFGDATFLGSFLRINPSLPSSPSNSIVPCGQMAVGISVTADGGGYWVATSNGNVVPFGDAPFEGTVGTPPIQNGNNC